MDGVLKVWAKAQGGRGQEKSEWVALAGGQQPRRGMAEARPLNGSRWRARSQAEAVENTPWPSMGRLHPLKGSGTQSEPVPIALRATKGVMREQMVYFKGLCGG